MRLPPIVDLNGEGLHGVIVTRQGDYTVVDLSHDCPLRFVDEASGCETVRTFSRGESVRLLQRFDVVCVKEAERT